jgi:DNA polymerase sigma
MSVQVFNARRPFREALLLNVTEIVKSLWPKADVGIYGSYATRLHLGSSDIDLVVSTGLPYANNFTDPATSCGQLADHFGSLLPDSLWIREMKVLQHLPVPLVKVRQ